MKKFKFKLQALLELRESRENEIKNELMRALAEQNRERALQDELRETIKLYENRYSANLAKGKLSAKETMMLLRYVDDSRRAIDNAQVKIEEMDPGINEIRSRLLVASREKKVVENLKEKRMNEFNLAMEKEMAKENDDINQKLYGMNLLNQ